MPNAWPPTGRRTRSGRTAEGRRRAIAALLAGAALAGAWAATAPGEALPRPDAETIRSEADEILSSPRFAERRSVLQSIIDWFSEKLGGWDGPSIPWAAGWLGILQWIILAWCVLTLLAILAHFAWTAYTMVRSREAGVAGTEGLPGRAALAEASLEELEAWRDRLARQGRYREAVAVTLLLLFRHLDACGLVRFHASKTNGEYVREFPRHRDERDAFRHVVRACDTAVYSAAPCGAGTYERLETDCARIRNRVETKTQI